MYQISLSTNKFAKERYLWSKTEKVNIIIEFRIFKLVLLPNFRLNWQFWIFWPYLSKKGVSGLKLKKWTPHIFYIILHIQISIVRNFSSNWQLWFHGSNFPKKVFPVKNWKSEHHHWIPHIQISLLVPNFCFNWQFWFFWPDLSKKWAPRIFCIILHIQISLVRNYSSNWQFWVFLDQICLKRHFPLKTEKVNITMEVCIFELV